MLDTSTNFFPLEFSKSAKGLFAKRNYEISQKLDFNSIDFLQNAAH